MSEREELEKAIQALQSQRAALGDAVVDSSVAVLREKLAALEVAPGQEQKRRQITVLFLDVVGSTAMVRELDPEDNLALVDQALQRLAVPIREHGGRITRFLGDGFMALFGHPLASENDPDQAVRAALAILVLSRAYAAEVEAEWGIAGFDVRIGISTGLAVIGGESRAWDSIAGAAVNLAARLESAATPGTVLISSHTYRHVRGAFDLEPGGAIEAKGFADPVTVYRVLREKPRSFRTRRRGVEGVETHMIGRDREMGRLQKSFGDVLARGERQMVTLVGEAGIGKSRLMTEFESWVDLLPESVRLYQGRARPETQNLPYGMLRDMLADRFEIQDDDPMKLVWEKTVSGFVECLGPGDETEMKAAVVGSLIGFGLAGSPGMPDGPLDPQQVRDRSLAYLIDYFKAAAELEPLLLLLEDLHWADDSSLDLMTRLALALRKRPVFLLGAARPALYERRPDWMGERSFHERLDLRPLSRQESRELLEEVLQKAGGVPAELEGLVVDHTGGNPFYVEELVKMLVEERIIETGEERWRIRPEALKQVHVPPTLTGVLQARLEGLPERERAVLQQASVVGRVFWDAAVGYLNRRGDDPPQVDEVLHNLEALNAREMIYRRELSAFREANEHIFKHAILREVTYESVLKRLRRTYHALAAEWLIDQSGERSGEFAGLIADHLENAGKEAEALGFLQQAGESAAAAYANDEAVTFLTRALALVPNDDREKRFQLLLARVKIAGLRGDRQAQAADLASMEDLAALLDRPAERAEAAVQRATYLYDTGDCMGAIEASGQAVAQAKLVGDQEREAEGRRLWGLSLSACGQYLQGQEQLELALALARQAGDRRTEGTVLNNLGPIASSLEEYPRAQEYYEQALELGRQTGDRYLEGAALNNLGNIYWSLGNYPQAADSFQRALAIAREIGDRQGEAIALNNLGVINGDLGQHAEAARRYGLTLGLSRDIGDRRLERISLSNLGGTAASEGEFRRAQRYYHQALEIARAIGDRRGEGYVLDGLCDALVGLGELEDAAAVGRQAVRIREELGQLQLAMESRATLAAAERAAGNMEAAAAQVEAILAYMDGGGSLEGTTDPVRIYLLCAQVLQAARDSRERSVLESGYELVQERLARFQDEETRRKFLENSSDSRKIISLCEAARGNE